jgi:UDP-N-acetylglucosamine--N-acetylmuramyl-(pentapeptide) pyrophosphoryl-undecaprenol N-acetylglucosamine transferase
MVTDKQTPLRILIAGGGTGGHIIPALAIARVLTEQYGAEVHFVGTARGLETRLVPQAGYKLELVKVGQLKNVSLQTKIRTMLDLPLSLLTCLGLLMRFRPQVVVGVGGYASGPAMGAAILWGTPTLAFEPNAAPGLANRIIGRFVNAAAVNFAPAAAYFRKAEVTGIPVRAEFFSAPEPSMDHAPHLLVFGGSQGARILNELMPKIVGRLLAAVPGLAILHQAGARHAESTQSAYMLSGADSSRWHVSEFLDDMAVQFGRTNLVLARSGASTVAELAAAGKPSLLIPFAAAADDHQRRNAEVLAAAGAAEMILESEATPDRVAEALVGLLHDQECLHRMSVAARGLAHRDAAERIAARVVELARK